MKLLLYAWKSFTAYFMVAVVYFDEADAAWDREALFSFNNIETSLSGALWCASDI